MESESDQLRVKRRSAKGKFTRQVRTVQAMIENERSHSEVYVNWETLQRIYETLQDRHDAFCETIDPKDEATYEEEEAWMEQCRETYVKVSMAMNDYIRNMDTVILINDTGTDKDSNARKSDASEANDDVSATTLVSGTAPKTEKSATDQHTEKSEFRSSTFKLEYSQMPKFSGDVREYAVFRSDFKDLIEPKCSKRDAVTLLRNNLSGKAHELIKGMGNDYAAAWDYLDSVYGDPRVVADAITYDITSFRALQDDDDDQFCELCHLVRRSFNTLKDIGRQADLDNNHMLAIIEQKMSRGDRKVWSRKVEEGKMPATLEQLLHWMTIEMKSRMRASALIRDRPESTNHVHYVAGRNDSNDSGSHPDQTSREKFPTTPLGGTHRYSEMPDRCWICKSSAHWIDECERLKSMSPVQRVTVIKENHACYCCLKRTGKNHTAITCYRRRQCNEPMEHNGNEPCKEYHHPLLHTYECTERISNAGVVGVAGVVSAGTMLPILDVYVLGKQKERKGANLLLDSGAQISLIRTQLAEELNLRGENVTITVNKVGGNEETLKTKRYDVCVQSMDKKHTTSMSAIGMPHITDDISSITNLSEKARQLKIPLRDIHRGYGPVDLLVGINCPLLHTGETIYYGNMIARKSPLGWVIFGTEGLSSHSNRVLNVQVVKSVVNPAKGTHASNIDTTHAEVRRYTREKDYLNYVEKHKSKLTDVSYDSEITGNHGRCYVPCNKSRAIKKRKPIENTPKANKEYANVYHEDVPYMKDTKHGLAMYRDTDVTPFATMQTRENTFHATRPAMMNRNCSPIHAVLERKRNTRLETSVIQGWVSTAKARVKPLIRIRNVVMCMVMMIVLIHPHGHGFKPAVAARLGEPIPGEVTRSDDVCCYELQDRCIQIPGSVVIRTEGTFTHMCQLCERQTLLVALRQERKRINSGYLVITNDTDTVPAYAHLTGLRENFLNREDILDEIYRIQEDRRILKKWIPKYETKGIRHCASSNDIQQLLIETRMDLRQITREYDTVSIHKLSPNRQMDWRFITLQSPCTVNSGACLMNMHDLRQISNYLNDTSHMRAHNRVQGGSCATVSHGPFNESKHPRHRVTIVVWQIGRIVETYLGSRKYERAVSNIVVLYPSERYDNESSGGPENESANVKVRL